MLFKLIEFLLHRYLLANLRKDGYERATTHIEFSKIIWEVKNLKTYHCENHRAVMKIHDLIANHVTDNMPKTIGFDFLDTDYDHDFDLIKDKLFQKILKIKDL